MTISNQGNYLTLCEVEVYKTPRHVCNGAMFGQGASLKAFQNCREFMGDLVITGEMIERYG